MKKFRNLSLVLAGFALGVTVAFSPQIHAAANSLLGSKVGKVLDVKINNKSIGSGAVINGTTYVPLRVTANEMGLEVTKVDSKEVNLSSGSTSTIQDNSDQIRVKINELDGQIGEVKVKLRNAENVISNKQSSLNFIKQCQETLDVLEKLKAEGSPRYSEAEYNGYVQKIETTQTNLDNAERDLPILKQQLADLEKQKADLEAELQK
ncbi:stalk domain-containing protein [Paenibacillus sp. XY044]|uniref:stalk domain-containing protein n=1 Tax=Paenibacillus sp. XY044 TaxID=2026089 RepID=UPI000B994F67|nr:stalk domain-containing protein [Paenibacillus sp. XY044]OZB90055.1 hypothetical protein CJP46_35340 [Paenibacillus sp. XY044]